MLDEKVENIKANREKMRNDIKKLISQNSRLSVNRNFLEETCKKPDILGPQEQPQNSKKNLQRKKSLNINILPRSFEMFECG